MTDSSSKRRRQTSLRDIVAQYILKKRLLPDGAGVVVGVSGGPDSLCLLDILHNLAPAQGWTVVAAHLDHQLRGAASYGDAEHVQQLCEAWGVPSETASRDIAALAFKAKRSIEETARLERYRFLAEVARNLGYAHIAVAHHADDQVETVLMHLLRGTGLAGLRGMLPSAPLEAAPDLTLIRPLLPVSRHDIVDYCREREIVTRLDRSNLDTTYQRNRIRHELIPTLESYNPGIRQAIVRTAESMAGDYDIIQAAVDQAWANVVHSETKEGIALDRKALGEMPPGLARRIVRRSIWRLRATLRDISWTHIEDALAVVHEGHTGARATLPGNLELTLGYGLVWVAERGYDPAIEDPSITTPCGVDLSGETALGSGWTLVTETISVADLPENWRDNPDPLRAYIDADRLGEPVSVRPRETGDRFVPLGETNERSVRRFMINAQVPAAQRDTLPLFVADKRIVWVIGWRLDARFAVRDDTQSVLALRCIRNEWTDT